MITCIVMYIILMILVVLKRKKKLPKWMDGQSGKQMLLILFVVNTVSMSLFIGDWNNRDMQEVIERNAYGQGKKKEEYEVSVGKKLKNEPVMVEVEEQEYSKEEVKEIFQEITDHMEEKILGENESLDRVECNLNLISQWDEYPVQVQWELDSYEVMNAQGEIQEENTIEEGTLVELRGTLRYGEEEALYVTNAMVYPKTKNKTEQLTAQIEKQLKQEEEKTREQKQFTLPKEVEGDKIQWKKKVDMRGYFVLLLGIVAAALIPMLKKQNEQKAEKEKQEQMMRDYPEIINKFTLLLSTGGTIRSVWERIVRNYREQKPITGVRAAYEEMEYTYYEMQGGIAETEAYERFGQRCGNAVYMKFAALLAQNMKKGTKGMTELLRMESIQAFENRKSSAKRKGEETGTKLLIPMFGMLAVVLVIIIIPAFLSIQL